MSCSGFITWRLPHDRALGLQAVLTPAGVECRHYYEDFNRGRQIQECRLIGRGRNAAGWTPDLCARCPVPAIERANGSPDLRLEAEVVRRFGIFKRVKVRAFCVRCIAEIDDPMRGCPTCSIGGTDVEASTN